MGKAIPTVEGWHSQHMVFAMDFSAWNCFTAEEKAEARNELKAFLADLEAKHQAKEGSYAFYDCNGAKGDLILWVLGPSLEYLAQQIPSPCDCKRISSNIFLYICNRSKCVR